MCNGNGNGIIEPEEIRRAELAIGRTRTVEALAVLVACVAAILSSIFGAIAIYQIYSCTNPGGRCYQRYIAQARTQNRVLLEELKKLVYDSGKCQLLQILEHRDSNEMAHQLDAKHHGYLYSAPLVEAPPAIPDELRHSCDDFLTKKGGP